MLLVLWLMATRRPCVPRPTRGGALVKRHRDRCSAAAGELAADGQGRGYAPASRLLEMGTCAGKRPYARELQGVRPVRWM